MDVDRYRGALVVGDLLAIAVVLGWGFVDHHQDGLTGLADVGGLLEAVAPFAVGYLVVAALAGTYGRDRTASLRWSLRSTAATWLGGLGVGLVIRTSPVVEGGASWPFGLVLIAFGLPVLLGWRLAAHLTGRRTGERDVGSADRAVACDDRASSGEE